jgi:hypothetical protein
MKRHTKLNSREQELEQEQATHERLEQPAPLEFATAEAMLRHDALHTPVPPAIAHRLEQSLEQSLPAPKSLWRRLFGK